MEYQVVTKNGELKDLPVMLEDIHFLAVPLMLERHHSMCKIVDGRYILQSGTIYPSNDKNAQGIIVNDYDLTDSDVACALLVHGIVNNFYLPEEISEEAKEALPAITVIN